MAGRGEEEEGRKVGPINFRLSLSMDLRWRLTRTVLDSVLGKVMERVGGIVHSASLVEKGSAKRAAADAGGEGPVAN